MSGTGAARGLALFGVPCVSASPRFQPCPVVEPGAVPKNERHPTLPWGALAAFASIGPEAVSPKLWPGCTAMSPKLWLLLYNISGVSGASTCPSGRLPYTPTPRADP